MYVDLASSERDLTLSQGKQGVILAHSDIFAGKELGAALPDNDGTGFCSLAAVQFNASVLRIAVSTVSG